MKNLFLAFALLTIFATLPYIESYQGWIDLDHEVEDCYPIENAGLYCNDDFKGYKRCDDVYVPDVGLYMGLMGTYQCPEGTKCSCGRNADCEETGRHTKETICASTERPPYEETFSLRFEQTGFGGNSNGEIIRDGNSNKYYSKIGSDYKLVLPGADGSLTEYHWTKDGDKNCLQSQNSIESLPFFQDWKLDKLDTYSLLKSTKNGNKITQVFHYAFGGIDSFERWIKVALDPKTGKVTMMNYKQVIHESGTPEFYGPDHKAETTIKNFSPMVRKENWAMLPNFDDCWEEDDWEEWDDDY